MQGGLTTRPLPSDWMAREGTYRWNDQGRGEIREPLDIVPRIDVTLSPAELPWRTSDRGDEVLTVVVINGAHDSTTGTARLELPEGWPAVPPQSFTLTHADDRRELRFTVRPPSRLVPGSYTARAIVEDARQVRYAQGRVTINYPHIHPRSYLVPAESRITVLDLALPSARHVAYIRGAADHVPEALIGAGMPIDVVDGSVLSSSNLARFDAIVIGPRAYETDTTLVNQNARLIEYARQGGLVIVQYQQYGFYFGNYAPYALYVASRPPGTTDQAVTSKPVPGAAAPALLGGHDRVTDEHAIVTVIDSTSPVLRTPNRIGPADWDGWIQERGLYFAHAWSKEYRTVLEMHDPGESALEGGLLIAKVGKGTWVYTGLSFFRQLPAGVPGAFRLFANLLSIDHAAPAAGKR